MKPIEIRSRLYVKDAFSNSRFNPLKSKTIAGKRYKNGVLSERVDGKKKTKNIYFFFFLQNINIHKFKKKSKSSHTLNISSIHCFCLLVCCLVLFLTVFGDFGGLRNTGIIFQTQRFSPSFTYSLWVDCILGRANCRVAVAGGALVIFFRISVTPVYG